MANELQWLFKIIDNLTAPAERMAASIDKLEQALNKTSGKLDSIDTSTKKAAGSSDLFSLKLNATLEIASKVASAIFGVASAALDFGLKTLHAAAGAEKLKLSMEQVLGVEGAKEVGGFLEKVGKTSAFSPDQLKQAVLPLARAGFRGEDLERALAASEDLAQGDLSKFTEALFAFQKISLKGGIDERALVNLGIKTKDFYASLAKVQGVSEKAAEKMAGEGKIKPDVLIGVLQSAIAKSEGGTLGNNAVQFGGTLEAILNRLAAIPQDYLQEFSKSSAFGPVKEFISNLVGLLSPDGEFGQRAIVAVGDVFSALFGGATSGDATAGATKIVDTIIGTLEKIPPFARQVRAAFDSWLEAVGGFDNILESLKSIGSIIGFVVNVVLIWIRVMAPIVGIMNRIGLGVVQAIGAILDILSTLATEGASFVSSFAAFIIDGVGMIVTALFELPGKVIDAVADLIDPFLSLPKRMFDAGVEAMDGLLGGLKSMWGAVTEFPRQLGGAVVDAFKMTLGIKSPSKVFRAIGENTVAGYVEGIEKMTGSAVDATAGIAVAPPSVGGAGVGGAAGGAGSPVYTFNFGDIMIDGAETSGPEQARELATRLRGAVQSELEAMFQRMAIEQGVG